MAFALRVTKNFQRFASILAESNKYDSVHDLWMNRPIGCEACVKGWVKEIRKLKNHMFINVNDGSCKQSIQVVLSRSLFPKEISIGSSVSVSGKISTDPKGNIEVYGESIDVLGKCDVLSGFPFTPGQKHNFEYSRQFLNHRPKLPFFSALLRTRHSTALGVHKYFTDNKFIGVHTPILTSNDCEGAGETFIVKPSNAVTLQQLETEGKNEDEVFFKSNAYLTVSGQFHLEAITRSIPKVYTFNPTFRAENSKSRFHLSEFYMVEAEEAFIVGLQDLLHTMETLVKSLVTNLLSNCESDVNYILENNETDSDKNHMRLLETALKKPFTVIPYSEAKDILYKHTNSINSNKRRCRGFTKEEELFLVKYNDNIPIFVINWPVTLKPFYMKTCKENSNEVQAVDLLVPGVGELCGGSVREDDYDVLHEKLEKLTLLQQLNWYLELRKFGNVPTGGFGMGFERFLQYALGISNIKDTIPFPRWPHNLQL